MAEKTDCKWLANFECLKAYIAEHHHLPPKSATEGKWMLNFAKYTRRKIKKGSLDDWKRVMFESLMAERYLDELQEGEGSENYRLAINDAFLGRKWP